VLPVVVVRTAKIIASITTTALLVVLPATAARASGTWGATGAPFLDGVVCQQGESSSPLAAWDFGIGAPAFLLAPVSSAHGVDSATLPFATNGIQRSAAITAGSDGFDSSADVAAYAYLVSHYHSGVTGQAAAIARAVMARTGSDGVPDCASGVDDLLQAAREFAGPYTVRLNPPVDAVAMGTPTTISVTVTSASGQPVPGMTVGFTSDSAAFDAPGITDADGVATARFTIAAGTTAPSISLGASVTAALGLNELIAYRDDGSTTMAAIYPAAPVTVAASANVRVDPSASPVVHATASSRAIALGQGFLQFADVTGLRGHAAGVQFTVLGPVPAGADGRCGAAGFTASTSIAAKTDSVSITGDQRVTAAAWTPSTAGCYSVQASTQTLNASPNSSAHSSAGAGESLVAVVPTSAGLRPDNTVVGPGSIHAKLTVSHDQQRLGSVRGEVLGPLRPTGSSCAGLDFSRAPTAAKFALAAVRGDGDVALTSDSISAAGCYRLHGSLTINVGDLGPVAIPVADAAVLAITPALTTSVDRVWANSPDAINAQVEVRGTGGQPAHLSVELAYAPASPMGCRSVDWARAPTTSAGTPTAIRGDGDRYAVRSAPTRAFGCYLPVARLTVDANPAIVVTAALANQVNAVGVGVDPNGKQRLGGALPITGALAPLRVLCLSFAGVLLVIAAAIAFWTWRRRYLSSH
jgi:hypothetical protein